jgi:regulator of cell morphogenesis and NO signaling
MDWHQAPLAAVAANIVRTHHAFTRHELALLRELLPAVVVRDHELDEVKRLAATLDEQMRVHMANEEHLLFPYIQELEAAARAGRGARAARLATMSHRMRTMVEEHDHAAVLVQKLRVATDAYNAPPRACHRLRAAYAALERLEADLAQHMKLEADVLFRRALKLAP